MANAKLVLMITSILLALTFFNGFFSALGRPLMKIEDKEHVTTYGNNIVKEVAAIDEIVHWRRHMLDSLNSGDDGQFGTDDFRPTDPGHSPGAGHSSPHAVDLVGAPMP